MVDKGKIKLNKEEVLEYITLAGEENLSETIGKLGESLAYQLYESKNYKRLNGELLYYIYEVVVNNLKVCHFGNEKGEAQLHLKTEGSLTHNGYQVEITTTTSNIDVTDKEDMRNLGEEHFKEFVTYYLKYLLGEPLDEELFRYNTGLMYRMEAVVQFLRFTVNENVGVISKDGFYHIKDEIIKTLHMKVDRHEANTKTFSMRKDRIAISMVEMAFKKAENEGLGGV